MLYSVSEPCSNPNWSVNSDDKPISQTGGIELTNISMAFPSGTQDDPITDTAAVTKTIQIQVPASLPDKYYENQSKSNSLYSMNYMFPWDRLSSHWSNHGHFIVTLIKWESCKVGISPFWFTFKLHQFCRMAENLRTDWSTTLTLHKESSWWRISLTFNSQFRMWIQLKKTLSDSSKIAYWMKYKITSFITAYNDGTNPGLYGH